MHERTTPDKKNLANPPNPIIRGYRWLAISKFRSVYFNPKRSLK
jgi:hypothetical protein